MAKIGSLKKSKVHTAFKKFPIFVGDKFRITHKHQCLNQTISLCIKFEGNLWSIIIPNYIFIYVLHCWKNLWYRYTVRLLAPYGNSTYNMEFILYVRIIWYTKVFIIVRVLIFRNFEINRVFVWFLFSARKTYILPDSWYSYVCPHDKRITNDT